MTNTKFAYMADWISDRFKGKPMKSMRSVVDDTGRVHRQPGASTAPNDYGLPDLV